MRKLMRTLLVGLATVALMAGCDVSSSEDDTGTVNPPTDQGGTDPGNADTYVPPAGYFAIMVEEGGTPSCSNNLAHGADIDAVQLSDSGGTHVAWYSHVQGAVGTGGCEDKDPNAFTDLSLLDGYVSLNGGFIAGEFDSGIQLIEDYTVTVYEAGSQTSSGGVSGKDEPYNVYAAYDMTCAGTMEACAKLVGNAVGEADVPLGGTGI